MTMTMIAENMILKEERQFLIDAHNKSIKEIQDLSNLSMNNKTDILGILNRNMQEVVDKYPKMKELL